MRYAVDRPILTVIVFASLVRVLAMAQVPLVITNDGVGYATWAQAMLDGAWPDLPIFRTPGYPLALAGVFAIGGVGPWPVLAFQHALGVATCALIALGAHRLAGNWAALLCGLLAAADLRLLGFACYLLSETLAVFLLVLAMTLAMGTPAHATRRPILRCAALGGALGALCLTRPAFQIAVPFLALAALAPLIVAPKIPAAPRRPWIRRSLRQASPAAAALALTFALVTGPWLVHNAGRGIHGLSGANSVFFWLGARKAGVLEGVEPPQRVRPAWDRLLAGEPVHSDRVYPFLVQSGAWSDASVRQALSSWRREAIAADLPRFATALGRSALWQLDIHPSPPPASDARWLMRRLRGPPAGSQPAAPNFQFDMPWDGHGFAMPARSGPLARLIAVGAGGSWSGILNFALAACAVAALIVSALRRQWAVTLALLAVGACMAAHVATMLPYSRFGLPMWVSWYLAPAVVLGMWSSRAPTSATPAAGAARTQPPRPPLPSAPSQPSAGAAPDRPQAGGPARG